VIGLQNAGLTVFLNDIFGTLASAGHFRVIMTALEPIRRQVHRANQQKAAGHQPDNLEGCRNFGIHHAAADSPNSARTSCRCNTISVNTPRTVPKGTNTQLIPATTMQNR